VVNKVDSATADQIETVVTNIEATNPSATIVQAASPVRLSDGPSLEGRRVLVVEDGPTTTHGGMAFGAGTVAARQSGAIELVDPRPAAVGSIVETFTRYPHVTDVLPAMGYGDDQLADLAATIAAVDCDVVVTGTPIDLGRLIDITQPVRHASYVYADCGEPTLRSVLAPSVETWLASAPAR